MVSKVLAPGISYFQNHSLTKNWSMGVGHSPRGRGRGWVIYDWTMITNSLLWHTRVIKKEHVCVYQRAVGKAKTTWKSFILMQDNDLWNEGGNVWEGVIFCGVSKNYVLYAIFWLFQSCAMFISIASSESVIWRGMVTFNCIVLCSFFNGLWMFKLIKILKCLVMKMFGDEKKNMKWFSRNFMLTS